MSALLSVRGLTVRFGGATAVEGASFDLAPGEALGVVGESGSGKSMTCRALMALTPSAAAVTGSARLEGDELLGPGGAAVAARGRRLGMVFQVPSTHLDPLMRVGDQVAEGLVRHDGLSRAEARRRAVGLLEEVRLPEPERWARAYPHELSGGMKQRAMIAAALAPRPAVLLADEPTTALDVTVQAEILALIGRACRERGMGLVLVSHDLAAVAATCDRVLVMRAGRIVEEGPTVVVVSDPRHPYTRALLDAHPGRLAPAPASPSGAPPLLEAGGVTIRYARRGLADLLRGRKGPAPAVRGADLSLRRGGALGIVGESGSGKSTLARALTGLVRPEAGRLRLDGREADWRDVARPAHLRRIQLIYQHPAEALSPRLPALAAVAEPIHRHGLAPRAEARRRAAALMEEVGLGPELHGRRPSELSGGQCQRVAVARALALDPEALIADEATSALDVTVQAQLLALLARLRRERGLALILISHDLGVVRHLCDRVVVMRRGEIVEAGETARVLSEPAHPYTRALVAAIPRLPGEPAPARGAA